MANTIPPRVRIITVKWNGDLLEMIKVKQIERNELTSILTESDFDPGNGNTQRYQRGQISASTKGNEHTFKMMCYVAMSLEEAKVIERLRTLLSGVLQKPGDVFEIQIAIQGEERSGTSNPTMGIDYFANTNPNQANDSQQPATKRTAEEALKRLAARASRSPSPDH
ncbi:hypothetical protein COY07_00285 [Candidatus Peregrinibacteria bacterium CG_4_10_14_0_2_um_filter_43_11]|nr:MAG: hypothetical protein COY07_00285 [Candidatus Peregrinibacteria bacterium CG_4_10_14_0_2_um_filter_43_11]